MSLARLKCVVTGLDGQVASDLIRMLTSLNHVVSQSSTQVNDADMVFCDAESMQPIAGQAPSGTKIVAVGSDATEESWLSALEQGACDYLPMPCQPVQLTWILQSHFRTVAPSAA
jgi:DNA-binding NtrC family response regulator